MNTGILVKCMTHQLYFPLLLLVTYMDILDSFQLLFITICIATCRQLESEFRTSYVAHSGLQYWLWLSLGQATSTCDPRLQQFFGLLFFI